MAYYGAYKQTYVAPLTEMGYEFDATILSASDRYQAREMHSRSEDEWELMLLNAVCFREGLLQEGHISEKTKQALAQVGFNGPGRRSLRERPLSLTASPTSTGPVPW